MEGTQGGTQTAWVWTGYIRFFEEVTVGPGERLRIGPGALIQATSSEARLVVEGSLKVVGADARPTVLRVPVLLAGGEAEAHVRGASLWPKSGAAAIEVGPNASLTLHDSHVRAGGDGVVVQAIPGHDTPRRDVTAKGSLITGPASGTGAGPDAGAHGSDEAGAALRLEMLGRFDEDEDADERGTSHGHVWVQGNRFVGNDVGVAVDGWDTYGVRFQENRFEDNRRGVLLDGGDLNLHDPVFRDNDLAAEVDGSNATLHVRGSEIGQDDVDIAEGSSGQVGDQVVRAHPRGSAAKVASALAAVIVGLYGLGKWVAPRAFLAQLLTRGPDDDHLKNKKRQTILELLEEEPGVHLRELGRAVGGYRNAVYHTRVLEDAGMVRSERDGGYKRFYPAGPEEVEEPEPLFPDVEDQAEGDREDVEPRSTRAKLLELVREEPGIKQVDAAWELGCSRQLVSYHARRLEDEGVIVREEAGVGKSLHPGGG